MAKARWPVAVRDRGTNRSLDDDERSWRRPGMPASGRQRSLKLLISRNKRAKEFWQKAMRCKCIYQVAAPHGPVDRHLVCNFDSNLSTVLYKSFTYLLKRQMWQNLGIFVLPTPNYRDCRPHPTRCIIGWFEAVYQVYCSHFAMVDLHDQPTKPMTATSCIAVLYLYNRLVMCN